MKIKYKDIKLFSIPFFFSIAFILFIFIPFYYLDTNSFIPNKTSIIGKTSDNVFSSISSSNEVTAAVFAILLTVAAIIVELASTRYSSRIIDLFIEDKVNLFFLFFFVSINIHSIIIYFLSANNLYLPVSALTNTILLVIGFIMIIPYFAYIFQFLKPENVILKIQNSIIIRIVDLSKKQKKTKISSAKYEIFLAIEQISDICLNAIDSKDTTLGTKGVLSLKDMIISYLGYKTKIPDLFFKITEKDSESSDYVTLSPKIKNQISQRRTLLENKVFKHYALIFNNSLNNIRDINNMIAMCVRLIGQKASDNKDKELIELTIKYFNTFLRYSLNSKDIRTSYNILYQYKIFANYLLNSDFSIQTIEIIKHFKYYGLLFFDRKLGFILETVAHDICDVCIEAKKKDWIFLPDILNIFLTVDRPSEPGEEDRSLRGVRKAQIKLASFFHYANDTALANIIIQDMIEEPVARIISICKELDKTKEDFWEIIDRGSNFDFIPGEWKDGLFNFLNQFKKAKEKHQKLSNK